MARARPPPDASPERRAVDLAVQPFVALSALSASVMMTLVGLLFLVPLWLAASRDWTGAGVQGLGLAAPGMLLLLYLASRAGIRRQLGPLASVGAELARRLGAQAPRAHGRLRKGWGCTLRFDLGARGTLEVVAARGQGARPELYLVRGGREHRFRDPRTPLPELDEALRAVGLDAGPGPAMAP